MKILYFLEGIRNPVLDQLMLLITEMGFETVFLVIALWMYWCVDKKKGLYCLVVGFFGLEINQLLKMICRIPRPWVIDPNFTIVERARKDAGGYSFPSGHTQIATGIFGSVARCGEKITRIFATTMILLVALSRMYLGVHTPADVGTSLLIGTVLVFVLYPVFFSADGKTEKRIRIVFFIMIGFSFVVNGYVFSLNTSIVDEENLADAVKTVSTIFGSILAIIAGYYIEKKYVQFEAKAPMKQQLIKYILGLAFILMIKSGLKMLFVATALPISVCDMIRYACMVLFAFVIWPLIFTKYFHFGHCNT